MRIGAHTIGRHPFMGTILWCVNCQRERTEKKGVVIRKGQVEEVWYLGCECPKPSGIL